MLSGIKEVVKFFIYSLMNLFINPSRKITNKTLLLIRLDAIGDYILFRDFIKILKTNGKYKDFSITLLGNIAWKELAEEFDKDYIDKFIWIDRAKFSRNLIYRYIKLKEITSYGYEVVLNPRFSREFFFDDMITKLVTAKEKIGNIGDLSNMKKWQKNMGDQYYTKLLPAEKDIKFEFYRNREFFENLFGQKLSITKPLINLKFKKLSFVLPERYAILFIGASGSFRKWSIENFSKVGKHLKQKYDYDIVLCGAVNDYSESKRFKDIFDEPYLDLVGKTNLIELSHVIYNAEIMVSNETVAPHLAVALGSPIVFVIYNGNHFGRFTPYPEEMTKSYYVIYHPLIKKNLEDYKVLSNTYGFGSQLDINEVTSEMVIEQIDKVLGL